MTRLVLLQLEQSVKRLRHIVLAGVVHEIKDHQALFSFIETHTSAKLLRIKHFRHGRTSHEQNLYLRAVPAFVEQFTCAKHLNFSINKLVLKFFAFRLLHAAGHRRRMDTGFPKQLSNLLCVLHRGTENHGAFVAHILEPCIHNQAISLRNINLTLQIADVILDAIKPNFGQVDIGMDSNTPNGHQFTNLHSGLDIQLMGRILKDVQDCLIVIGSLRCGR